MEHEVLDNQETMGSSGIFSQEAIENLSKTAPWIKFLSIMGFIMSGFFLLVAFFSLGSFGFAKSFGGEGLGIFGFFIYIILAVVVYLPNKYLYNYATELSDFCLTKDSRLLEIAFLMQKKYWSYMGVLVIVYLALIVLGIIGVISSGIYN